ncbi:cytochrome c, partial [Roseisolibacter sp. H3M3-2]|uniref:c-type cytochrome n=1 Tax=Roseisolibacter sp. H3M3-2 TaxID=3031323 RepID=UPI0023DBB5C9
MPRTRLLALAALLPLLGACDWFTDFKNQPRIEAWEPVSQQIGDTVHAPRGQPAFAVPVTGTQLAGYQIGYGAFPGVIDSIGRAVTNPTAPSEASLANGRKQYQINCAVCHGDAGQGDGPATKNGYGMPGINIVGAGTQGRTDGYLYGMMRNGRGLMPSYNRIEEMDRWDVVNYVRALQGRVPNSAGVGPTGYPGQNGTTVPGHSQTAPTRPAPFFRTAAAVAAGAPIAPPAGAGFVG